MTDVKIAYGSDFHFEFYPTINDAKSIIETWVFEHDTKYIIIAGDLHVGAKKVFKLLTFIYDTHKIPVVYVPGNHEYYRSSFYRENDHFYRKGISHEGKFYILLRNSVSIGDIDFYGCLGNIDGSYEHINIVNHVQLNDFHMIKDFDKHDGFGMGEFSFFLHNVKEGSIVITHTMPSPKCISERYKGDHYNPCFTNDWSEIIYTCKPKIWICGHTHECFEKTIYKTDVLCNPYGYPHENKDWEWKYFHV